MSQVPPPQIPGQPSQPPRQAPGEAPNVSINIGPGVPGVPGVTNPPGNGLAVAGMILGIVSCALFCIWWLSLPSAVVGLVLSILGKNKAKQQGTATGMATAGMILSIIALGLAIVIMIAALAGFAMFSHAMQNVHQ